MLFALYYQLGKIVQALENAVRNRKSSPKRRRLPGLTLYHFYVSLYSRRVRTALYQLSLDIPLKDILADSAACEELIKNGGLDQVPCLKIEKDGQVKWMYESQDIIAYLKKQ